MSFLPARKLSCGIVILNDAAELLLCHVTGHDHWDLPKGGAMAGETPLQAALRETAEIVEVVTVFQAHGSDRQGTVKMGIAPIGEQPLPGGMGCPR